MNLLAIETSSAWCSVALLAGDTVAEQEVEAGQTHSGMVLPMAQRLLRMRGLSVAELDGIAYGAGPGAFTGLRIACGIAQGLAAGAALRVVGVCTLEALADEAWQRATAPPPDCIVACLDARMGEVYHAAYRRQGEGWRVCSEPGLYAPQSVPVMEGDGWTGAGNGFAAHGAMLRARQPLVAELPGLHPHACTVARLAEPRFARGEGVPPARALPLYLRDKVALTVNERNHERHPAA
jgi:tRNA threonylcarbamoyladenosine biosynthesis protein TsaB